jgi:hypothetical protein
MVALLVDAHDAVELRGTGDVHVDDAHAVDPIKFGLIGGP